VPDDGASVAAALLLAHAQAPVGRRLEQRNEIGDARGKVAALEPVGNGGLQLGVGRKRHLFVRP
jgi:hypothetical protein